VFGIAAKGRIAVGYDADLTVVDLKRRETITDKWIASRAGWTPYAGVTVTGWPVGTVIRGHKAMWRQSDRPGARRTRSIPGNFGELRRVSSRFPPIAGFIARKFFPRLFIQSIPVELQPVTGVYQR